MADVRLTSKIEQHEMDGMFKRYFTRKETEMVKDAKFLRTTAALITFLFMSLGISASATTVWVADGSGPTVEYGVEVLIKALEAAGIEAAVGDGGHPDPSGDLILVGTLKALGAAHPVEGVDSAKLKKPDSFAVVSSDDSPLRITGFDDAGIMYGCLELADRVKASGKLPENMSFYDAPSMRLRGPCLMLSGSRDGIKYDALITPETYPFFFDRDFMLQLLDHLARNRLNTLYLWSGHPFTSFLRLPEYPDARELPEDVLERNIEQYRWLTQQASRRGIWIVQKFYNIHLSHALVKARNIDYPSATPTNETKAYIRYCLSEFIKNYPRVAVMPCLGEYLNNEYDAEWLGEVIIAGVKDGLSPGQTPPPIIVRGHSTKIQDVMGATRHLYDDLYTMRKHTSEVLASTRVDPRNDKIVGLGQYHIVNIHSVANIKPWRWGSPKFIQDCMKSIAGIGASGLHFYLLGPSEPRRTPDSFCPLTQLERDWIWIESWARYAWNPDRDTEGETEHWTNRLTEIYGSREAAGHILSAYDNVGPIQPTLTSSFAVTTGNYAYLAMGITLNQLLYSVRVYNTKPGLSVSEFATRQARREGNDGLETPYDITADCQARARKAAEAMDAARPLITKNVEEFERLAGDVKLVELLANFFAAKVEAAVLTLVFSQNHDRNEKLQKARSESRLAVGMANPSTNAELVRRARRKMRESVEIYQEITQVTDRRYRAPTPGPAGYASIPFNTRLYWKNCLPLYEKELDTYLRDTSHLQFVDVEG
jgi:hypothetical protein